MPSQSFDVIQLLPKLSQEVKTQESQEREVSIQYDMEPANTIHFFKLFPDAPFSGQVLSISGVPISSRKSRHHPMHP